MFDFKKLKIDSRDDKENTSSFVGIRRNVLNNELEFRLPRGFDEFPKNDFNATKKLFFKMYRTFKKFEHDNKRLQSDNQPASKDNLEKGENAYKFKDNENNEVILYSKISVIDNLLETYRDLALDVIIRQNGRTENIDYSKIDRYLHKATYLDDNVIYINEMDLSRYFLDYKSSTLIDLFCFILYELESELEQESDESVKDLANRLRDEYLTHDQSLFNEDTFDSTIIELKDILNNIDKVTPYKDDNYWQLYESIESFLYGELNMQNTNDDGIFWGISNFYQIWEDMCNTYAFSNFDIVYSDTNILFQGKRVSNASSGRYRIFKKLDFKDPFFLEFRNQKRLMRPDLIHVTSHSIKDKIFKSIIKIEPIKNRYSHKDKIDFFIKFIGSKSNKNYHELYKLFLKHLKHSLNSRQKKASNISGASVRKNRFSNYPESKLIEVKNRVMDCIKADSFLYQLLDWKYMDIESFQYQNKKVDIDISKQLCYEFCLQKSKPNSNFSLSSQFVIPYFDKNEDTKAKDDIGSFIDKSLLYQRINDNKIQIFKANFNRIQDIYLNND